MTWGVAALLLLARPAPALLLATLLVDAGPIGEEIGRRGCALPRMLHGRNPLAPAVLPGVVWGLWHLPAFVVAGTHQHDLVVAVPAALAAVSLARSRLPH